MDESFYFNDCKEGSLINITRDNNYVYLHVMKDSTINKIPISISSYNIIVKENLSLAKYFLLHMRKIHTLTHFTSIENLDSILEYGILSKKLLIDNGLKFTESDPYRFDNLPTHISTSVSFPNYRMFYSKRMSLLKRYVVLEIKSSQILRNSNPLFFETDAANSYYQNTNQDLSSIESFNQMFKQKVITGERYPFLPDNYPTDPQAEIMLKDKIDISSIRCIHYDVDELSQNVDIINSLARNVNIDCVQSHRYFNYREDFNQWR